MNDEQGPQKKPGSGRPASEPPVPAPEPAPAPGFSMRASFIIHPSSLIKSALSVISVSNGT
jgi:hypothetical protein